MSLMCPRSLRRLSVLVTGAATIVAGRAIAAVDSTGMPRVRSSHAYIRAMIDEATARSPSFRHLVDAIDATNGIVYVEHGNCGHNRRACLTMSISSTAEHRILHVLVDVRQPDWDVMASIGHELQHSLEVLGNANLRTTEAIYLFYSREAPTANEPFETQAAVKAGNTVRQEVVTFARRKWK